MNREGLNPKQRSALDEIANFINWYTSDDERRDDLFKAACDYVEQDHVLADDDEIAITWTVDDVMYEREDLSESQAREVLKAVKRNHDAEIGVNWDVIRTHADEMFPAAAELQAEAEWKYELTLDR